MSLKFVSWNIRGIGSQAKKTQIFNHLTKLQADICLLQETHLSESDHVKIKSPQYSQTFSTFYNSRQRGVSILIKNNI